MKERNETLPFVAILVFMLKFIQLKRIFRISFCIFYCAIFVRYHVNVLKSTSVNSHIGELYVTVIVLGYGIGEIT